MKRRAVEVLMGLYIIVLVIISITVIKGFILDLNELKEERQTYYENYMDL